MALTNHERVSKAMELLREGLAPYVEREVQECIRKGTVTAGTVRSFVEDPNLGNTPVAQWDVAGLLKLMWHVWNNAFQDTLGHSARSWVSELREWRNHWAHQRTFSSRDAERMMDTAARLLSAISAPQADEMERMMLELRRLTYDEQVRSEKRKAGGTLVEAAASSVLRPWREVVSPHPDVASGNYQQAEFAADLWQVHLGSAAREYQDPAEFFRRTYLTESLQYLLVNAIRRLSGQGGDPVVQLQTNFGGGKTHSMLALYHLFSGEMPGQLAGVETLMAKNGFRDLPSVRRVVLVGNKISPGNPVNKPDGTVVRTLWGELAYQLGGKEAYARIARDDELATNPGDALRELFDQYGPCLILIDEWVAYARQLHDQSDLPGGNFETQFTFAQALTESAKLARKCLLVISLPASDTATAGRLHAHAEDVEVGGLRGREALDRLRNVVGRVETSWRPASAEESFEIVRRRLFQMEGHEAFKQRDVTARAFSELYQKHGPEFPSECREADYEKRIQAAYPIHPEVFDRLYGDWSTLVTFQRTRGVLRLMATVVHVLWVKGDKNPLILPSTIPMDDENVQKELTRYLPENWTPILQKDVDGKDSVPVRIDSETAKLGQISATRRVARTIWLGSAPKAGTGNPGIDDLRLMLGCVMPGETPAVFGDALRRLLSAATYLYSDQKRYWYDAQPTVAKLAEERKEQLQRNPDLVMQELEKHLREALRQGGDFARVHPLPQGSIDVPDEKEVRLVVLSPEHPYAKGSDNPAEKQAQSILERRGNYARVYRNTLVFLAADGPRLQDLEEAVRQYLAWNSILRDRDVLNLTPLMVNQAEKEQEKARTSITARLPETYIWLLVPEQATPKESVSWQALKLSGSDGLAVRAARRLKGEDRLVLQLGTTILRKHLDEVPLWRGNHVDVRQLVEDFASYLYLPRLARPEVLTRALSEGVGLLSWSTDTFAYAESFDEEARRYRGLRAGQQVSLTPEDRGLVVRPEVAREQMEAEKEAARQAQASTVTVDAKAPVAARMVENAAPASEGAPASTTAAPVRILRRFHGTVELDATRVGRDAGKIADEVIAHLTALTGARVSVSLEIDADLPKGVPDTVVRIVNENCRTLKFTSHGFEEE